MSFGLLDRFHDAIVGVGGAIQAPFGLVKDLAIAPFDDTDDSGPLTTTYDALTRRGGQMVGNLLGPEEGLGALIGGLPSQARSPVRRVTTPAMNLLEGAWREGVSQPISTALTAASLAEAPGGGGLAGLADPRNWREAYGIAEHRSPGQALALAFATKDITDPDEVAKAQGTDFYRVVSGTTDAVLRVTLDPLVVAGKVRQVTLASRLITSQDDIARLTANGSLDRFAHAVDKMNASEIRLTYFPEHAFGADISSLLADAGDATTRVKVLRTLMGATDEIEGIRTWSADLAGRLDRLTRNDEVVRNLTNEGFVYANAPDELARGAAEIDALYPELDRLGRIEAAVGALREAPRATLRAQARGAIVRSDWYQSSRWAKPLRVVFDMEPHHIIRFDDPTGDIQFWRWLQQSDLDLATQEQYRARYMAAGSAMDRENIIIGAEHAATRSIAEKAGMTADEIGEVLKRSRVGRERARAALHSRKYDGEGRARLHLVDDDGTFIERPLLVTQEAQLTTLPDMHLIRQATKRIGQFRLDHPTTAIPRETLEAFYRVWKPSVLLRVGWPLRVIGDEQLRILAKIGALAHARSIRTGLKDAQATQAIKPIRDRIATLEKLGDKLDDAQRVELGALRAKVDEIAATRIRLVDGYRFEGPFGAVGDGENIYRHLASSRDSFQQFFGRSEKGILDDLRNTGEWRSIGPDDVDSYTRAWEHAVNHQIGEDAMARQFLEGATADDVARWLRTTAEGRAHARRLPFRRDHRAWAEAVEGQVHAYLPTEELRQAALKRHATHEMLAKQVRDASARPIVHGEILGQSLGTSKTMEAVQGLVDRGYKVLGSLPSDALSRNRFFDSVYTAEVQRQVRLLGPNAVLDGKVLASVENAARRYALRQTKTLLYDLAEQARWAEMLRFFVPFGNAWQEVLTRWAGLVVENPAFARRMQLLYMAPEKAGIVTDEQGYVVDEHGKITEAPPGFEHMVGQQGGSERNVTIRLPEWAHDIPGLRGQGNMKFGKNTINLMLQGPPGFGPVVQVPANEIAKARPDLEAALNFVLPYGSTQETRNLLLPATARRFITAREGEENRLYANSAIRRYYDMIVDYNLGKREERPTWQEAKNDTDAFWNLRTAASYIAPFTPQFDSPYQLYIDSYRLRREWDSTLTPEQRQAADYLSPDEWFLQTYGEEFFPLTQSLSKSIDGIPPTLEGHEARLHYQDLIETYPELGSLIIGKEGAGEFSRAVYDAQLATRVAPGAAHRQRESQSFEEATAAPNVRLGWLRFRKFMDLIDAERVQRGLPNLQVKEAEGLATLKRVVIEALANRYPEWYAEFSIVDRQAMSRRLEGMAAIVTDKRLIGRPEIQGLATYLRARQAFQGVLAARKAAGGAQTLEAVANQDVAAAWATVVGRLTERNLAFADLYYRWLTNDDLRDD